jgi:hypothetical protein
MDYVGIAEIPKRHILKRWTRDARDVLPPHLRHYQRDEAKGRPVTYRHSTLYILAMELVRLGDASSEAYEKLVMLFKENLAIMAPFENARDGLGLEDRMTGGGQKRDRAELDICNDTPALELVPGDTLAGLAAPSKKLKAGRPSTSREKAPYEGMCSRTRFCSICKKPGHKKTTCPERGDMPKQPRREAKCSRCGIAGHRKSTCLKPLKLPDHVV